MSKDPEEDKRELVIERARRYRDAVRKWEALSRDDPAGATRQWREVKAAERSLFDAIDRLDEPGVR
jgi:hypothetical protein